MKHLRFTLFDIRARILLELMINAEQLVIAVCYLAVAPRRRTKIGGDSHPYRIKGLARLKNDH